MEEKKNIITNKDKSIKIEDNKNKKGSTTLIILAILLFIVASAGWWSYFDLKSQFEVKTVELTETSIEKNNLQKDLDQLMVEYNEIETDNDTLNAQLNERKERILELQEVLKKVKSSNRYKIAALKKELGTLREVMRSFVYQIDSLNTLNHELIAENIEVKSNYKTAQNKNQELSQKNQDLSSKVEIASVIKGININATAINRKSKSVTKIKKVEKIKVCFTLSENNIVKAGNKKVYVRIARPDELVLASSETDLFEFEGNKIIYSAFREVEYENNDIDVCIFWNKNQELIPGIYSIDIFTEGKQIGSTTITLK